MADRDAKNRQAKGEGLGWKKLTAETAREIRAAITGEYGEYSKLGRKYGVSHTQIRNVVNGISWKHVV